jgi:hypothetical protein
MASGSNTNKMFSYTMVWGIVLGLISVAYYLAIYLTDAMANTRVSFGLYPALGIACVFSVIRYRNKYHGGYIGFGHAFAVSFVPFIYTAIINTIYQLLFLKLVMTQQYIDNIINKMAAKLATEGYTPQQIEVSIKIPRFMFGSPKYIVVATIVTFVAVGALTALVSAAICRKEAPGLNSDAV